MRDKALRSACESPMKFDAAGTLYTDELTLPPSDYWSEPFKACYAKFLAAGVVSPDLKIPARNACKAEWDRFDEESNRPAEELLATVRKLYPAEVEEATLAGVRVGILTPQAGIAPENAHRVLINVHGGGFVFGRGLTGGQLESMPVAALGRIKVITLDYRQAPFHAYPAASDDVEAVYRELLKTYDAGCIGIYGCSSGGDLTGQSLVRFQKSGLPRPGAAGILSFAPGVAPWPFGKKGDSRVWLWGNEMKSQPSPADKAFMEPCHWYMQNADPRDPQAFPATSDDVLSKFPPTLLLAGTREYWFSPAIAAHVRLLALGVDASLYVMEGAWHGAHVFAVDTPEAQNAQAYIAHWFNQRLAR
jgi:epsilon-lactone hydrolase